MVARFNPMFITQRRQALIANADRVEKEIGVSRSSGMFLWALVALHHVRKMKFNTNMKLMKSFGWSEADFLSAFRKALLFLYASEKMLARMMEFLVKEAGCKPSYIAHCPLLLMYSLDRILIPRHRTIKILMSRYFLTRDLKLCTIINYSEVFVDRFVVPHRHEIPELQKMFMDVCRKGSIVAGLS